MTPDQRNRLEADLRDIVAPELRAVGAPTLYIIWESDTGRRTNGLHGFTGPTLASIYADQIEAAGRWQGIAPGLFICDSAITSCHGDNERALRTMVSTAAHEAGHVIAEGCEFREANPDFHGRFKSVLEDGSGDLFETDFPEGNHNLTFCRMALHMAYRLELRGHDLEVDDLWREGELFKPSAFLPYISDELERLQDRTLSEVLATDPPEQFAELYRICGTMAADRLVMA